MACWSPSIDQKQVANCSGVGIISTVPTIGFVIIASLRLVFLVLLINHHGVYD
jgi:hypothetical protein